MCEIVNIIDATFAFFFLGTSSVYWKIIVSIFFFAKLIIVSIQYCATTDKFVSFNI